MKIKKQFDPLNPPTDPKNGGDPPFIDIKSFPEDPCKFNPPDRNDNDDKNITIRPRLYFKTHF